MFILFAIALPVLWVLFSFILGNNGEKIREDFAENKWLRRCLILPASLLGTGAFIDKLGYIRKLKVHVSEYYGRVEAADRMVWLLALKLFYFAVALEFVLLIGTQVELDLGFGLFGVMIAGAAFLLPDTRLDQDIKKRRIEIMLDFPEFLVKLTLLINAGMTVSKAWERVSESNDRNRALGKELKMSVLEIRAGKSEFKAYEDFAKRCRMQEVTRVVSVLLQNMRKGNEELVSILRVHANECWEMRKNAAKKLGEEASSKMLLPMAIMLVSILLIVTTPAIIALQGF